MGNREKIEKIRIMIVDVDGTLTDGGIYYDEHGNELKKFCTKDAAGFFAAHKAGIKTVVITGRKCEATTRRMSEMKVDYLVQDCKDKVAYIRKFLHENHISEEEMAYVGDDLNDLPGMSLCGFVGCPEDSCKEVKKIANYISPIKGGHGAFRDVVEYILSERGQWEEIYKEIYGVGV